MSIVSLAVASGILAIGITSIASPMLKVADHEPIQVCASRQHIVNKLTNKYKEKSVAFSIAEPGASLIELYNSKEGATWTIVLTNPKSKMSCVVAYGENWNTKEVTFDTEQKL